MQAELQALSQHRGLSTVTSPGRNFSMSSEGYSEPVDVQLNKSLAKATIKLGARVTTLEAKVCHIRAVDERLAMGACFTCFCAMRVSLTTDNHTLRTGRPDHGFHG